MTIDRSKCNNCQKVIDWSIYKDLLYYGVCGDCYRKDPEKYYPDYLKIHIGIRKNLNQLIEFNTKYQINTPRRPSFISDRRMKDRLKWSELEKVEYEESFEKKDMVNLAKELGDRMYLLLGDITEYGLGEIFPDIMDEIHRSNMSKNYSPGKLIKGENYSKADIKSIFERIKPVCECECHPYSNECQDCWHEHQNDYCYNCDKDCLNLVFGWCENCINKLQDDRCNYCKNLYTEDQAARDSKTV